MPKRTIVLSDTHLGVPEADPEGLAAFVRALTADAPDAHVVLNGDVLDLWRARDEAALAAAAAPFAALAELLAGAGSASWVVGNHDYHVLSAIADPASAIAAAVPEGVAVHHPYLRLEHEGARYLVTHGDVCDLLYVPLEELGPLSWMLEPADVYAFYEWVRSLDEDLVEGFDRAGLRGLFRAWLTEVWGSGLEAALAGQTPPAPAPVFGRLALGAGERLAGGALDLREIALPEVRRRVAVSLRWRGMRRYAPWPSRLPARAFRHVDHVVVGHFHDARQVFDGGRSVTDDGSWWGGPGSGGDYAELTAGGPLLRRWS